MGIGTLFLAAISTGIVTKDELLWVKKNQVNFSQCEKLTALRLGNLVHSGQLQLGYRY